MFTGLIETTGTLLAITPTAGATRITIASPTLTARLNTGDSVAVNGVCLTALDIEPNAFPPRFSADLAAETLARTTLAGLDEGSTVNLGLPARRPRRPGPRRRHRPPGLARPHHPRRPQHRLAPAPRTPRSPAALRG